MWCIIPPMRTALILSLTLACAAAVAAPPAPSSAPTKTPEKKATTPAPAAVETSGSKTSGRNRAPLPEDGYQQLEMMTRAMEMIRQNYVDDKKVDV